MSIFTNGKPVRRQDLERMRRSRTGHLPFVWPLVALALLAGGSAEAQKFRVIERPKITLEIRRIDAPPPDGSDRPL